MKDLMLWKDEQFRQLKDDMDRLFSEFAREFTRGENGLAEIEAPRLEMSDDGEYLLLTLDFPGLDPQELEISVAADRLRIEGRRKEQVKSGEHRMQRSHRFSQQVKLPCRVDVDRVEATCHDHHLEIRMPRSHGSVYRKIEVHRSGK